MVTEQDIREVAEATRQIRRDVVTMVHLAGDGHPGPALSIAARRRRCRPALRQSARCASKTTRPS